MRNISVKWLNMSVNKHLTEKGISMKQTAIYQSSYVIFKWQYLYGNYSMTCTPGYHGDNNVHISWNMYGMRALYVFEESSMETVLYKLPPKSRHYKLCGGVYHMSLQCLHINYFNNATTTIGWTSWCQFFCLCTLVCTDGLLWFDIKLYACTFECDLVHILSLLNI